MRSVFRLSGVALFTLLFTGLPVFGQPSAPPVTAPLTLALAGDSTVSNYEKTAVRRGWGQLLPEFLAPGVIVLNEAKAGASTKSFPAANWRRILAARPAFVLIQFGHNDSHPKTVPHATDAATDYKDNLRRYVREAREAGITPILVTPVRRRQFGPDGQPTSELAPYANAMIAVAVETGAALLDLQALSGGLFATLGEAGSRDFTPAPRPAAEGQPPSKEDRTHFTETGAREIARLVARALPALDPRLRDAVRLSSSPTTLHPATP